MILPLQPGVVPSPEITHHISNIFRGGNKEIEKDWCIGTSQVATVADNLILARTCGASLSYFVAILFILTLPMIHGYSLWKHPCDLARGRVFLRTVPSQRVYCLNYFLMPSLTWSTRLPLASPPHASSRAFSFPHPPTPTPPF